MNIVTYSVTGNSNPVTDEYRIREIFTDSSECQGAALIGLDGKPRVGFPEVKNLRPMIIPMTTRIERLTVEQSGMLVASQRWEFAPSLSLESHGTVHALLIDEMIVAYTASREHVIMAIEVAPAFRGRGLGRLMVACHCAVHPAAEAHDVQEQSVGFWERLGFMPHEGVDGDDIWKAPDYVPPMKGWTQ